MDYPSRAPTLLKTSAADGPHWRFPGRGEDSWSVGIHCLSAVRSDGKTRYLTGIEKVCVEV